MFWEALTVDGFADSLEQTKGVCILPLGCLEKHGNHLPLGTDIYIAREVCARAARQEEVMIFPFYPIGIVAEVKHKLGTIAVGSQIQFQMLEAICEEISRNGYKKIILGNGHGGNSTFLRYFAQAMGEKKKDFTVYVYEIWHYTREEGQALVDKHGPIAPGGHADIIESSDMLAIAPELVHMERVRPEESVSLGRADWYEEQQVYTGINWYAAYPYQFAGDPTGATAALGEDVLTYNATHLVEVLRKIKNDDTLPDLFQEFYADSADPKR